MEPRFVLRVFRCEAYRTELSPTSCGARHKRATKGPLRPGEYRLEDAAACVGCVIGRAHSKGHELPSVTYRDREEGRDR